MQKSTSQCGQEQAAPRILRCNWTPLINQCPNGRIPADLVGHSLLHADQPRSLQRTFLGCAQSLQVRPMAAQFEGRESYGWLQAMCHVPWL